MIEKQLLTCHHCGSKEVDAHSAGESVVDGVGRFYINYSCQLCGLDSALIVENNHGTGGHWQWVVLRTKIRDKGEE